MAELVRLLRTRDPNRAEIIKNALEAAGVACHLDGENQAGLTGILEIDVIVRQDQKDQAQALLTAMESGADGIDSDDSGDGDE